MRKLILLIVLLMGASIMATAQTVNTNAIKQKINATASHITSMQCSFVQTKHLKMLNDKMVSTGVMYYQQGNKLRWEYKNPYSYTFILNDSKVLIKNNKRNDVIDVKQNKVFKEVAKIMMNSVVGKCLSDEKDFKTSFGENATSWIANMTPLKKDMRRMFQKIVLHFDKKQSMVSSVELYENNGDKTIIQLKDVQTNKTVSPSVFAIG